MDMRIRNNNQKSKKYNKILTASGVFAVFATLALASSYLFAPVKSSSAADNLTQTSKASAYVPVQLSMSLNGEIGFDMVPKAVAELQTKRVVVKVDTNASEGYRVVLSTNATYTDLKSKTTENVIPTISEATTSANMPANTWAYSLDESTYRGLTAFSTPTTIAETQPGLEGQHRTINVDFGLKADANIDAGVYKNAVIFTVFANGEPAQSQNNYLIQGDEEPEDPELDPEETRTIYDITYMQDMNHTICHNTTTPSVTALTFSWEYTTNTSKVPRKVLIDQRDGKKYLVSKYADGRCWMGNNLDLVFSKDDYFDFDSYDTDLNYNSYITSYNVGTTDLTMTEPWDTLDLSDNTPRSSRNPAQDEITYTDEELWKKPGVTYNWMAGSAGIGKHGVGKGTTPDSICPRGWKLPDGINNTDHQTKLLKNTYNATYSIITTTPLYYLDGYYMVGTENTWDSLYNTYIGNNRVVFNDYIRRAEHFYIRCVAR